MRQHETAAKVLTSRTLQTSKPTRGGAVRMQKSAGLGNPRDIDIYRTASSSQNQTRIDEAQSRYSDELTNLPFMNRQTFINISNTAVSHFTNAFPPNAIAKPSNPSIHACSLTSSTSQTPQTPSTPPYHRHHAPPQPSHPHHTPP